MTTDLAPRPALDGTRLVREWLAGKSPRTVAEYSKDLGQWAKWAQAPSVGEAARSFLALSPGEANQAASAWRGAMIEAKLAPATVRRRLAALSSLVKLARRFGIVSFALDIEPVKGGNSRDMRGPSWTAYEAALATQEPRAAALLSLLGDRGLRASEALGAQISDWDGVTLTVTRKGGARERLTLAPRTAALLEAWIAIRGRASGAILGISYPTAHRICAKVGLRPHALRHCATTRALDVTNGDVRSVAKFTGHKSLEMLQRYDDERRDVAGDVARAITGETRDVHP